MAGAQRRKHGRHRSNSTSPDTDESSSSGAGSRQAAFRWATRASMFAAFIFLLLLSAWQLLGDRLGLAKARSHVSGDVPYTDILKSATRPSRNPAHRHLNASVLAYVTPWNAKGYDMAKKYRAKFTHVSPVWYQLKRDIQGLALLGKHDVDQRWVADVRKEGFPLIVPRVAVEGWYLESMLVELAERQKAINLIVNECKEMKYDGIVLEAWSSWASFRILENQHLRQKALEFVEELGSSLHKVRVSSGGHSMQLIFVIPPVRGGGSEEFKRADLEFLRHAVDGFSLMTYDFSNAYSPGPNAPLFWVRACLLSLLPRKSGVQKHEKELAAKLLMGINYYGNDFVIPKGGGAIVGDEFMNLLRQHKPKLTWDLINREHYFDYIKEHKKHRVYYPTLQSLALRLQEAEAFGVGISIWEIGQGLESFYNLL